MAYITNDGARLIERARTEGKSLVFGSVRMNTIYKSDPTSLVQQTDEWFGESHGSVVGCISHVSVDEGSKVCDSKLAVQCNDNGESWKSLGIYARLNSEESSEVLFACESIENGEYKDVTIVELPVTLAGVVEDFGLSEGGSGGGGGSEVPANMMTTDTDQTGLSCMKQWTVENYISDLGSLDNPQEGDIRVRESVSIGKRVGESRIPLALDGNESVYDSERGWGKEKNRHLRITTKEVIFNGSPASWSSIIKAAKIEQGFNHAPIRQTGDGSIEIGGTLIMPNSEIKIGTYAIFVIDSNSKIASVRSSGGNVLDVSVAVFDSGSGHRVNGIVNDTTGLSFDAPITPAEGQEIYIHWARYA